MKTILLIAIILMSGCSLFQSPCTNINRLTKKHSVCFDVLKQPVTIIDTFVYRDTIITTDKEYIFEFGTDTIYEDKYIYFEKKGSNYNVKCKGDTMYIEKDVIRYITKEVPVLQPKNQGFNWNLLILIITTIGIGFVAVAIYEKWKKRQQRLRNDTNY